MLGYSPRAQASAGIAAGAVATAGSHLNVRSAPSTGSAVLTSLPNGSYVTLSGKSGNWWRVRYSATGYGYCHGDYIRSVSATSAAVTTAGGMLNVRSGAGTSHSRIAGLYNGESVMVLSSSGGWSRILFHGSRTGYVSAQYLSGGMGSISLNVPYYKQTDSRWADVPIGSSGKTMAQIGCATTAIAMMESYRTGTVIYPHTIATRLRYTTDGSVYWPEHYTAVTDGTNYLAEIYKQLQLGKPVLFGARNSYGKQHWVVITGFVGGSLSTANFTVQDPGSSTRTNLQHFLSAYPRFYKYFRY